jgi:DNA-binding transcriptional regulator YhcF (GntR family)/AcrR family transcriptional regulator
VTSLPPYLRIAADITSRIEAGELRPGDRVPSTRQITDQWGVAMATASKALATLRRQGAVHSSPGVGTVVAPARPELGASDFSPRRPRSARPNPAAVTGDRLVRTAVGVADAEGLSAISMRRIASELGVATMSLYRSVPSKDDLVAAMTDAVLGEVVWPEPAPSGWRPRLEAAARLQWESYRRHPWVAHALSFTRPLATANSLPHTEWVLLALKGFDLDPGTKMYVAITLFSYVRGAAVNLALETEARDDTGLTDEQWVESQASTMEALLASGRFPTLSAMFVPEFDFDFSIDALFEFGLQRLLDGLDPFLQARL